MNNLRLMTALIICSLFLTVISIQAQESKYVNSSDNLVKVKIPGDWKEMKLNDSAVLQFGNEDKGVYMLVLNDSKEDIEGWNIKKHSFITLAKLLSNVNSPVIDGPVNITVNSFQGIQYSIKGSVGGQMVIYLHTTFETPHTFAQVLTWTIPSQFEKNRQMMDGIINSFMSAK